MKDLSNSIATALSHKVAVTTAASNGTGVDLQGYEGATVVVTIGAEGDTLSGSVFFEIGLEESDDNSTFTDVTSNTDVTGGTVDSSGVFQTIDANADCNKVYAIGYVGGKRYSRVVLNFSGTHGTGTISGVVGVKGHPLHGPAATEANQ